MNLQTNIRFNIYDYILFSFLFVCLFTSSSWTGYILHQGSAEGEIIRFDKILLFGQANIYHIFAGALFIVLFFSKFKAKNFSDIWGENNFLKNIFILYFIPVNALIYITIVIKNIEINDLGVESIAIFFIYIVSTFYIHDIFFKNKNNKQLQKILIIIEVLILIRCLYSIIKYHLGFGTENSLVGGTRLGTEEDFSEFFILLLIIALTRFLFKVDEKNYIKLIHIIAIFAASYVAIFSFRRYFWVELIAAISVILFYYYHKNWNTNRSKVIKRIIIINLNLLLIICSIMYFGTDKIMNNYYIGRFLTVFSMLDTNYESKYGTRMGHVEEIEDGWHNVKKNWLLGVTPFGENLIERPKTNSWQTGLYVHNAFLGMWLVYGLLGLVLYISLYYKAIKLSRNTFNRYNNHLGLILLTFLICQLLKNIIWQTIISNINLTIVSIFLILLISKSSDLEEQHY